MVVVLRQLIHPVVLVRHVVATSVAEEWFAFLTANLLTI
jgi:hypothetical protein